MSAHLEEADALFFSSIEKRLYQPASPQEVSQIETCLQELQRSDKGWNMADVLLASEDANVRFFGALTFTVKINCNWDSLKEAEYNEGPLVVKKLCTALVAYFLRSSASWERCLLHLICSLSEGEPVNYDLMMAEHYDVASRVVTSLEAPQLMTAVWFATTLVEEVGRTSSESRLTHRFHDRLQNNLADFAQLLRTIMTLPKPESNMTLVEESIKCLQIWVVYGHGAWDDRSGQMQLTPLRALIPYTAPALWDQHLFEVAADSWTEILGTLGQFFPPESMEHLETFLTGPNAQDLLSLIVKGDYEPDARAYSRLLLAYGEVKLTDLARQSHTAKGIILIDSLMQLLAYDGYAGAEDDICTPAMEFWQAYAEFLIDEGHETDDQMEPWVGSARQYLLRVLERCWSKIRMPSDDTYAQWTSEAKGDFKVFRIDVVDLLQSVYALFGASILNNLSNLALDALQRQMWLHLEATLFCLNALADSISDEDIADATLLTLFGSELFAAMTNGAIDVPSKTQQTAVSLIISFASFFQRHPQFLLPMLNFLFVSIRTSAVAAVAAKAILSTADSCRNALVPEIDALLEQVHNLLLAEEVESASQERIFGAIAAVIQAVPSEEQKIWSLSKLLAFVERDVQTCEEFAEYQALAVAEEKGLCALRCLVSIGKYVREPDDIPINLESKPVSQDELYVATIWTSSQDRMVNDMAKIAGALGTDNGDVVELTCQVIRTGFRESFPGPFVFSPRFIEDYVISTSLRSPRLEFVLDTAGAMLSAHTRAGTTRIDLSATRFLVHLFQLITEMEYNPTNEPEVSSSCIDLASKYVPHYLHVFLLNPEYRKHVMDFMLFTIRSMQCQEIMPRRSAVLFWTGLFIRYDVKADTQLALHKILEQYGPLATQAIINNIGGDAVRSELENWANPLRQMVSTQIRSKQWIKDALFSDTFPSSKVGDAEKKQFLEQVMQ
ncbi:MAG: hypothetical protein LQ349_000458 [Xanthoria aureola]|nr:MAG: hypothetical protein LQ349_000458 [Xanthoria aureola]